MHKTTELVFRFLKMYKATHDGCSPTYRQISRECCLRSPSNVLYQLKKLVVAGLIRMPEGTRDIEIVGGQWTMEASAPATAKND